MMRLYKIITGAVITTLLLAACKKDKDPIIVAPTSTGSQVQLDGLISNETGGAAGNSVFIDLSSNKTTAVARASWDLGFYCGPDFRVVLNNTSSEGAKVLTKNDLASVIASDTIGLTLAVDQFNPLPSDLAFFDDISGNINNTVIPVISADDASNKVVIINRGTGGGIAPRPWMKIKILRNANGGYTLQYAGIKETNFRTLQIPKDAAYHFKYISFENGIVEVQPEKTRWDLVWSYFLYQTNFGAGIVPYNFSDVIAVNDMSGVQVKEKVYLNETAASSAYIAFTKDSLTNISFSTDRWAIGSKWRSTQPATGARLDRFYVIKDGSGNYYKFKCLAMGVGGDGGTRGKPQFKYDLIP